MPVTYRIDKAKQIIETSCVGYVTFDEVMAHFETLSRDPDCPATLDVLLDLSETTSTPASSQLRQVSGAIAAIRGRIRFGACAIVASSDLLYGMARMFEVFAEKEFRVTRVFRATVEAQAWLGSQQASDVQKTSGRL